MEGGNGRSPCSCMLHVHMKVAKGVDGDSIYLCTHVHVHVQ